MDPDYAQRRRFAVAAAITIVVIAVVVLLGGNDDKSTVSVTNDGVGTVPRVAVASPEPALTSPNTGDAMGELSPGFVTGEGSTDDGEIPTIVFAAPTDVLTAVASFDGAISEIERCYVPGAPFNQRVTVTNVDNGQAVGCFNSISEAFYPGRDDVVLATDAFATIADLTDSPVPVEVGW